MFTYDVVYVRRPAHEVSRWLTGSPGPGPLHIDEAAVAAWMGMRDVWYELEIGDVPDGVSEPFRVSLGPPRERGDATVVPISWPASEDGLVPALEADLEIAPLGTERTSINLSGSYALPSTASAWTRTGSAIHRCVQSGIRRFLELLAHSIERHPVSQAHHG